MDCDDDDAHVHPGATEICDGKDDDCDGAPHAEEVDLDDDGALDCAACDDQGFWAGVRDLSGDALWNEVSDVVATQSCNDYGDAGDFLFLELDNHDGQVECVYTGRTVAVSGERPEETDMNVEHSWPQSKGAGSEPAKCDLHHLYPSDSLTNGYRGNYPFGFVAQDTLDIDGGSRLGEDAQGDMVFEPRDVHKGNVARSMLYFAARYGYSLSTDETALYQAWDASDPVDDAEVTRSLAIAAEQVLANPWVVCPGIVSRL